MFVDYGDYALQQLHAVRSGVLRIGVGEKLADIRKPARPEQPVDDRVEQNVAVAVTQQPLVVGDGYPAQHKRTIGHEAVQIVTYSHAVVAHRRILRKPSAMAEMVIDCSRSLKSPELQSYGCKGRKSRGAARL